MAPKTKPYEQFGTFILFKKLESDSLSELWRAGRIENGQLGGLAAVRRFHGGDRAALTAAAEHARQVVPQLSGTSFAKHQEIGVINGTPYIAHEYSGGRSLRHIVDRARGGTGATPNPIPIEQAIVIAEKVALSLATTAELRMGEKRLCHGALIPQLIWITDDGEIRVAGQQLGAGIVPSLKQQVVAKELGRYFAPEYQASGEPSKAAEVFSMGAILHLLVTGSEPPDASTSSAFMQTVRAAKTMHGMPVPDDIRVIIDKSLTVDPATRFASIADMKQAIAALAHGGKYSATTFNLAFYLSNLLKKEMEGEAIERDKESKVNVAAYAEQPAAPVVAAPSPAISTPDFGMSAEEPKKSKMPLIAIAAVAVIALVVGGYFAFKPKAAAPTVAAASMAPAPAPKPKIVPAPIVAASTAAATTTMDPAAQKKAFEAAVEQKLQEEMMKLQADYTKKLQQQQSKNAPVQSASLASSAPASAPQVTTPQRPAPAPQPAENTPSAAALDERRLSQTRPEPTPTQPAVSAPQQQAQSQPAVVAPAPAQQQVREGDVVEMGDLDVAPRLLTPIRVSYPPMAMRQKVETTVIVTALVDENGNVTDVKVLKGDDRFGFNEAALRAVRGARFSTPTKNGRHVKTWWPQTIIFKL